MQSLGAKTITALRCSRCSLNWPQASTFTQCLRCKKRTVVVIRAAPMSHEEVKWERYRIECDRRDAEREARGDPTPEQLGALEAKEIIALEKAAKQK